METIKETTLYEKTEYLCADRDYVALNEFYHQLMDELSGYGFMPSSQYDFILSPDNILVTELYRCKYDFKLIGDGGERIRKQFLPPLDRSDVEHACMVDASVYSIVLSLAVLKEAPELYAVYCRPGALFFGLDSFTSNGRSGADKLITGKYLAYPDIARCYDIITFLRNGGVEESEIESAGGSNSSKTDKSDRPDANGWFPIHKAAADGNLKRFKRLASHGGHLYDRVRDGRTVLHIAVQNGNADIVHYLVEEIGFDIDLQERMLSKTALHRAIDNDDRAMVDYLVSHGADYKRYALSPLSYAVERNSMLIVKYFVNNGLIDVNSRDSYGEPPIYYAISRGNASVLRFLISSGASVSVNSGSGMPLVELAIKNGDINIVRPAVASLEPSFDRLKALCDYAKSNSTPEVTAHLSDLYHQSAGQHAYSKLMEINNMRSLIPSIAKVINVDADTAAHIAGRNRRNLSPFVMCELGMLPELLFNIERGRVNVSSRNHLGYTLLHVACDKGYERIVEQLIASGADVNLRDGIGRSLFRFIYRRGETPLHRAAAIDSCRIVHMLIEAGAHVDCYDYYHSTPLHFAAMHGNYDMVRMLVEAGADVAARDDDGNEPLLMAIRNGGTAIVGYLLDHGADINATSNSGEAPIHRATRMTRKDTALLLLRRGADINVQDGGYKSPLHIAIENGMESLAREYIACGADPYALDLFDKNAVHYASESKDEKLLSLFR